MCVAPYVHYVQPRLDIPLAPTSVPPPPAGGRGATLKAAAAARGPAGWWFAGLNTRESI